MRELLAKLSEWYVRRYARIVNHYWTPHGEESTLVGEEQLSSVLEGIVADFNAEHSHCRVKNVHVVGRVAELQGVRTFSERKKPTQLSLYFTTDGFCFEEGNDLVAAIKKVPRFFDLPYTVFVSSLPPLHNEDLDLSQVYRLPLPSSNR